MKEANTPVVDEKETPTLSQNSVESPSDQSEEDMFSLTEIELEEVSIDGICGVY